MKQMMKFPRIIYVCKICLRPFSHISYKDSSLPSFIFSHANKERFVRSITDSNPSHLRRSNTKSKKAAGVLIPLCSVDGVPSILFTQRSFHLRRNKGQVSFPGGAADDSDATIIDTALRETEEETGIRQHCVDVWCTTMALPDQGHSMNVTGVVGHIGNIKVEELTPNKHEVHSIFTVPIESLQDSSYIRHTRFRFKSSKASSRDYVTPVYLTQPKIWGLTAAFTDFVLGHLLLDYKPITTVFRSNFSQSKHKSNF